jgi:hypothetical protein
MHNPPILAYEPTLIYALGRTGGRPELVAPDSDYGPPDYGLHIVVTANYSRVGTV